MAPIFSFLFEASKFKERKVRATDAESGRRGRFAKRKLSRRVDIFDRHFGHFVLFSY